MDQDFLPRFASQPDPKMLRKFSFASPPRFSRCPALPRSTLHISMALLCPAMVGLLAMPRVIASSTLIPRDVAPREKLRVLRVSVYAKRMRGRSRGIGAGTIVDHRYTRKMEVDVRQRSQREWNDTDVLLLFYPRVFSRM